MAHFFPDHLDGFVSDACLRVCASAKVGRLHLPQGVQFQRPPNAILGAMGPQVISILGFEQRATGDDH